MSETMVRKTSIFDLIINKIDFPSSGYVYSQEVWIHVQASIACHRIHNKLHKITRRPFCILINKCLIKKSADTEL